jgi:hypothetical protein
MDANGFDLTLPHRILMCSKTLNHPRHPGIQSSRKPKAALPHRHLSTSITAHPMTASFCHNCECRTATPAGRRHTDGQTDSQLEQVKPAHQSRQTARRRQSRERRRRSRLAWPCDAAGRGRGRRAGCRWRLSCLSVCPAVGPGCPAAPPPPRRIRPRASMQTWATNTWLVLGTPLHTPSQPSHTSSRALEFLGTTAQMLPITAPLPCLGTRPLKRLSRPEPFPLLK